MLFSYVLAELGMFISITPTPKPVSLLFGFLYALVITGICLSVPKTVGMIFFAISNFAITAWAMAQIIYCDMFQRLLWTNDAAFASDGVVFIDDVLDFYAPTLWWVLIGVWLCFYLTILLHWPLKNTVKQYKKHLWVGTAFSLFVLCLAETSSLVNGSDVTQGTVPVYYNNGFYHLLKEDIKTNWMEPYLPNYEQKIEEKHIQIDSYFSQRPEHEKNQMTGILEGKNVIVVLMESLDDWMITPEQMPTVSAIMEKSIVFTDFYTPFYGTTRSINTEVCINTGGYFPTNGSYFYDYLSNSFAHTLPNTLRAYGYSSQVFHHNYPAYYRRTELIPALGYDHYQSYIQESGKAEVLNDCYPFDSQTMRQQFFREGLTFNMLITQAAHMPYNYGDSMSSYALENHPEYYGAYGSEEEDCIRVKARLVDDTFARLLDELEQEGLLEDTVIIALSDHYPYGYTNTEQLLEYSGGTDMLCLDNTPCFIWSADITPMTVNKTLNTSDLFPTILNMLGIDPEYQYLGRDTFDPNYVGYAFFADGSWASEGVLCRKNLTVDQSEVTVIWNKYGKVIDDEWIRTMTEASQEFTFISNLVLISDYYREP
jgi:phosphoglycerol transferase MdoB-like AlkP superfamily enzyme